MVEDRVTDGRRIGQLLASELDGRETGALARFAVVDADPDAEPSADGTEAYAIEFDEERVGHVLLFPESVGVVVTADDAQAVRAEAAERDVDVRGEDPPTLVVPSGATVKRVVDALVAWATTEAA